MTESVFLLSLICLERNVMTTACKTFNHLTWHVTIMQHAVFLKRCARGRGFKSVRPGHLAVRHVTLTVAKPAPQVLDEILELKMIDMELEKKNNNKNNACIIE